MDTYLGIAGLVLGALGLFATLVAGFDARRQRTRRERAVVAAHAVIERTYGMLITLKPVVSNLGPNYVAALNNGLDAIDAQRGRLIDL